MKVICISGKVQNGKDTTASIMREALEADGHRVLIAHYADLVKYISKTFFGWNGEKDEIGRTLLQRVGTDIVRSKRPNYWVDFLTGVLDLFDGEWDFVLIPDCRFPNEIECMCNAGFDTTHIRVVRQNFTSPLTEEQQQHPSETALDNTIPDAYINNYGTIEDLRVTISGFLTDFVGFHQMSFDELPPQEVWE